MYLSHEFGTVGILHGGVYCVARLHTNAQPILRQYCSLPKILRCWLTFDKELRFRLILQGHKRNVRIVRVWSSRDRGER